MKAFLAWLFSLFGKQQVMLPAAPGGRETPQADEGRKIKLAIVVGHTKANPGAKMVDGRTEYDYNTEVARLMEAAARKLGSIQTVICLRDGVGISGAYRKAIESGADAVIELHFNAFNGAASGTETLCTSDLTDVEFAHIIHGAICKVFSRGGSSRGVKAISRSGRGGQNLHAFPAGVNCLVEPGFGDHRDDAAMLIERREAYAEALIAAVNLWAIKKDLI